MQRNIITTKRVKSHDLSTAEPVADSYLSKLIKLIPAEVVSVYLAVFNIIKGAGPTEGSVILQWIVFAIVLLVTPFYLYRIAKIKSYKQIAFCTLSLVVWIFSIGGPLDGTLVLGYTVQFLGSIFLPLYTLIIPIFYDK
jgi:hypothetical protein